MTWDVLLRRETFTLRRAGRHLVAELLGPHRVLTTSHCNGGQSERIRFLLNHQSCEGRGHAERFEAITAAGEAAYHERTCGDAETSPDETAMMSTAANMNYAAFASEADGGVEVTAVVTAGVESNATCAGDPASWRETADGMKPAAAFAGTINTMLLVGVPLSEAALARAVMTMTEGKSAALQRLAVPSRQSADLATGTGTDQYCIAAPRAAGHVFTSASPHVKLGELIGVATRTATMEALRWQNGLESSYTRGLFHALGRYGVLERTFLDDMRPLLSAQDFELLEKNSKSVLYEPMAGASAHAFATVLDRVRHGSLPASVQREACVQQAATLAANLAAHPERWMAYRDLLSAVDGTDAKTLILAAIALGWSGKWR